ncbi:MAG: hypothetical protein WC742_14615 [Gallionellaceae bacterium]|jgi:hypothetical protein
MQIKLAVTTAAVPMIRQAPLALVLAGMAQREGAAIIDPFLHIAKTGHLGGQRGAKPPLQDGFWEGENRDSGFLSVQNHILLSATSGCHITAVSASAQIAMRGETAVQTG